MTAETIIKAAMRLIGALDADESPSTSELSTGLEALNSMLESWSNERLFAITKTSITLSSGTVSYTTTRPIKIQSASVSMTAPGGGSAIVMPCQILTAEQWGAVNKTQTGSFPTGLYCDYDYPNSNIYVAPTPNATRTLELWALKSLPTFADTTTGVNYPTGYQDAMRYNLALQIAPEFGLPPSDLVIKRATESYAALKQANMPVMIAQ